METWTEKRRVQAVPLSLVLGIVFDTATRKILVAKRKSKTNVTGLTWCFPAGKISYGNDLEQELKKKIKEKTGLEVESLGSVFAEAQRHGKQGAILAVYYLCELIGGNENVNEEFEELKWISPEEIGKFFPVHEGLKEYLINIK